jgi:diguanylate cyclase (GGDEF)-like protein
LDESVGVARLDGRNPRGMTAAWLGLEESDLAGVPERILDAIAERISAEPSEQALHDELVERLRASVAELRAMARSDALTRIANRRAAEERLTDECARAKRHQRALAVMLLDVDDLKQVNDTLGHAAGDDLLREVASRIQASLRITDFAARWGGDEFIVICPETNALAAQRLCMKLRTAVAARTMLLGGYERRVRISVGWAVDGASGDPALLLATADASLYRSKTHRTLRGRRGPLVRVLSD